MPLEHAVEGAPGELGAFDAGGHVRDVLELGGFVQVFQVLLGELLAADHGEEELCQAASFLDGLAGDEIGHDVGTGLADGAAVAGKGGLLNHVVLDTQLQSELVSAAGVDAVVLVRGSIHLVLVVGVRVVLHKCGGGVQITH